MTRLGRPTVYWQGEALPPCRPGLVYGFRLYPGGRSYISQYEPGYLQTVSQAVISLLGGGMATVWLDDAEYLASEFARMRAERQAESPE